MAINTSGFQVNVMPTAPVVDPRLLAFDPSQLTKGALQSYQLMDTAAKLKAFQAQQKENEETHDSRIANIKAQSEMAVMQANQQKAIYDDKLAAAMSELGLATAKNKGDLASLPEVQSLDTMKRGLEAKSIKSEEANMAENAQLKQDASRAAAAKDKAMAANYWAEAEKLKAQAASVGLAPDKLTEEWEKNVGEFAAIIGKTPMDTRKLYASGAVNSDGIPISSELASVVQNLKKPEFWKDPYAKISPELKQWLGDSGLQKLEALAPAQSATEPAKTSKDSGPAKIKIDSSGNIIRDGASVTKKLAPKEGALSSLAKLGEVTGVMGKSNIPGKVGGSLEYLGQSDVASSFDEKAAEAKYDELSQRINMTISSGSLSEEQKMQELEKLISEREVLWSAISQPKVNKNLANPNQGFRFGL